MEEFFGAEARKLFAMLLDDPQRAAEVVSAFDHSRVDELFQDLQPSQLRPVFANLAADDAADILADLPEELRNGILAVLTVEDSVDIEELMQDTRVIRNRKKLNAIVHNAQTMISLDEEHGGFQSYLRSHDSSLTGYRYTAAPSRQQPANRVTILCCRASSSASVEYRPCLLTRAAMLDGFWCARTTRYHRPRCFASRVLDRAGGREHHPPAANDGA